MSAHHHHRVTRTTIWPVTDDRVVVKDGRGVHGGETGTVIGRRGQHDWRYEVKLDDHEIPRLFAARDLRRPEEA